MRTEHFRYQFKAWAQTDVGLVRACNQDRTIECAEDGFFAVIDGMGGLSEGERTAEIIQEALPGMIRQGVADAGGACTVSFGTRNLVGAVRMLSDSLYEVGNSSDGRFRFGATFCGVWLLEDTAVIVSLGDSRAYLLPNGGELKRITSDHNVAGMLVQRGEMTQAEARGHRLSARLTRFCGMEPPAKPDAFIEKLMPGDRLLLCSDGMYGMAEDETIADILRSGGEPEAVCASLVTAAKAGGGADNISVAYIYIDSETAAAHEIARREAEEVLG